VALGPEAAEAAVLPVGSHVGLTSFGSFAEYFVLPDSRKAIRLPSADARMLPLLVRCGGTALPHNAHVSPTITTTTVVVVVVVVD